MSMESDDALFDACRARPDRENLVRLLEAHQDRLYNVCFQVLRHAQDAEDATQEVLLEILDGVPKARTAAEFRSWSYRVALNTAIDVRRRRARQEKATMKPPEPAGLPDEAREALWEALAGLDDETRDLVIEHHLERATLEDLGARRGVSAVAIWKRITKGREDLRRALAQAGLASMAAAIEAVLESFTPVRAPAGLVKPSVAAKAAAVAAAMVMGGAAVSAKTSVVLATILGAVLLFGGGWLGGSLTSKRPAPTAESVSVSQLKRERDEALAEAARWKTEAARTASTRSSAPSGTGTSPTKGAPASLKERLQQLIAFYENLRKLTSDPEVLARIKADPEEAGRLSRKFEAEQRELVRGLWAMVQEEPETYLAFLQAPGNAAYIDPLMSVMSEALQGVPGDPGRSMPKALADGLFAMMKSGTEAQQMALLRHGWSLQGIEGYDDCLKALAESPNIEIKTEALYRQVVAKDPIPPAYFEKFRQLAESTDNLNVQLTCQTAIAAMGTADGQRWLLGRLESAGEDRLIHLAEIVAHKKVDPSVAEYHERVVQGAMAKATDVFVFEALSRAALQLPPEAAIRILSSANPPTLKLRETLAGVVEKLRGGETNVEVLSRDLMSRYARHR